MYDFVAVDFETATNSLDSACSIGIAAQTQDGELETRYHLIRPPRNEYDEKNISIHHITPDMTADAPTLDELWPEICGFFDPHTPVLAHNAHFDMSVLRLSTSADIPDFPYIDTMAIASRFGLGVASLDACVEALCPELSSFEHHNAGDDAVACAAIGRAAELSLECASLWEMLAKHDMAAIHHFSRLRPQKVFDAPRRRRRYPESVDHREITPSAPVRSTALTGKVVVFTGELSMPRSEAMQMAVNAGAILKNTISRKVDYLVVGKQDKELVGEDGLSGKEEKAYAMNEAGSAHIAFIGEEEFIRLTSTEEVQHV